MSAVLTTVHPLQVVEERMPMPGHDVPLDCIVTPDEVVRVADPLPKPRGVAWEELSDAQLAAMPALGKLRPG